LKAALSDNYLFLYLLGQDIFGNGNVKKNVAFPKNKWPLPYIEFVV